MHALLLQLYYASFSYLSWLPLPALHSNSYSKPHSCGQVPAARHGHKPKINTWSEGTKRFKPHVPEINNRRGTIYWSERWIRRLNSKGLFHLLAADTEPQKPTEWGRERNKERKKIDSPEEVRLLRLVGNLQYKKKENVMALPWEPFIKTKEHLSSLPVSPEAV